MVLINWVYYNAIKDIFMIKKILFILFLTLGISTSTQSKAPGNMPDMNAAMAALQEKMQIMPYMNAPIESKEKLTSKDMNLFIHTIQKNNSHYKKHNKIVEKGYMKAAKVLPKGVSFDTFAKKSIALSGKQNALDEKAKAMGYEDALDLTLKSTRIKRAMVSIEMDKHMGFLSQVPKQQRQMMQSMISTMIGSASKADIRAVKPYTKYLKHTK